MMKLSADKDSLDGIRIYSNKELTNSIRNKSNDYENEYPIGSIMIGGN